VNQRNAVLACVILHRPSMSDIPFMMSSPDSKASFRLPGENVL
jgi:hypothetical protein